MATSHNKIFLAITFLALLGFTACRNKPTEEIPEAFQLSDTMMKRCEFTQAKLSDVKNELKLFGKITADNNKMAHVYPMTGGIVAKVNVELGDYVNQGDLLATLRSSEVADFQRQLLNAKSDVALAEKNLQVAKDLFAGKLNSEKDVMASEKELEKANAELHRIKEVYAIYHLNEGSEYRITAPIAGFIINKDITQNEELRSDRTEEVFSIAQITEVWVLANVSESNISKVALGYEADVQTLSYPDKIFKGKVDKIFNVIDPTTKAMKILVRINNPDLLLKPEMNATVNLKFSENKKMIAVPSSSVIFDKSKNWVMVYKSKSHIETRMVEVYHQLGATTYISSGLDENDQVISKNGLLIYDALND
ncbi:MAG: efflux RND transporter periplasmic adaptor subunit [Bacteroidetes bacterium]|nr:efflux RND transporter periplasmic adaptor subunit [Bacteroidota bacterium]